MKSRIDEIGIKAVSVAVPSNQVRVREYVRCRNPAEILRVERKTGISSIRVAPEGMTASDLCFAAAETLFADGYDRKNLIAVVFVSKTPDHVVLPPTSCLLQARLGLGTEVLCYDTMAACWGFIGGLQIAAMLAKLHDGDVLLMTGDTNSRIVHRRDSSAVMFGDGGAASIIGPMEGSAISFHIMNDGKRADVAMVQAGGFRNPAAPASFLIKEDERGNWRSECHMHLHGLEMMHFVLGDVCSLIQKTIDQFGMDSFDIFALHQPNAMVVKSLAECLRLPSEKVPLFVDGYGNISSASIPLGLCLALSGSAGEKGSCNALLAGFGGGLSWATAVTDLGRTRFFPPAEVQGGDF